MAYQRGPRALQRALTDEHGDKGVAKGQRDATSSTRPTPRAAGGHGGLSGSGSAVAGGAVAAGVALAANGDATLGLVGGARGCLGSHGELERPPARLAGMEPVPRRVAKVGGGLFGPEQVGLGLLNWQDHCVWRCAGRTRSLPYSFE